MEDALLRVYVEALTNIAKHSRAHTVRVPLHAGADMIALQVADDGRGFDPDDPAPRDDNTGWGLKIMKERAVAVGADVRVVSRPGSRTRVEFLIPKDKWE